MPIPTVFSLDATILARQSNLTGLTSGDTLDVIVTVYGFDPIADTQVQWVFTAKVSPTDSDAAATTVQKTISPDPTGLLAAGIRSVALSPTALQGHFALSQADTAKLVNCTSYDVRVFITRTVNSQQVAYDRTVLRGTVSAAAGTTGTAVLFTGGATLSPAGAALSAAAVMAGIGDVRNTVTDGNLPAIYYAADPNKTLSGSGVVTLPDARGGGFGPALTGFGSPLPQFDGAHTITTDGAQSYFATVLSALFDLSTAKCLFYIGTFADAIANHFGCALIQDNPATADIQLRSNGTNIVGDSAIGELDCGEPQSATPRIAMLTISSPVSGVGAPFVALDVPGRMRRVQWDNPYGAGSRLLSIGHLLGTSLYQAAGLNACGALSIEPTPAMIQSIERLGVLYGGVLALTKLKGLYCLGDSNMRGAGTTNSATKSIFAVVAAALGATYDPSNTAKDGLKAQDVAGVIAQLGSAAMNPAMTKIWVLVNLGTNDIAAGRQQVDLTADLSTIGTALMAFPNVRVGFLKIPKNAGFSGGQETIRQGTNSDLDAFVAANKATTIVDAPSVADPSTLPGGLHYDDTESLAVGNLCITDMTISGI